MRYEIRPLGPWLDRVTPGRRPSYLFRANWASTLDLLARETEKLDAALVVLQVDVTEGEIRRDGMLRANAKVNFPGVRVSFNCVHGPLMYSTDEYDSWQANVRAIALALEALRAVDRYGVSRRGEQYTGWRAITAGRAPDPTMTPEAAAALIADEAALAGGRWTARDVFVDPAARSEAFRVAARRNHPDAGGNPAVFAQLSLAREVLGRS